MMADRIIINDVGPRDGLQNQARVLSPSERLRLIRALIDAGLPAIEVGSFVSPRAVPAMANTEQVVAGLFAGVSADTAHFSAFVPNLKGYELARQAGLGAVNLAVAATDTMNRNNIRMSTAQAVAMAETVIAQGRADGIDAVPYIATAWACPYEGRVDPRVTLELAAGFFAAGASTVVFADTIGAANPAQVKSLLEAAVASFGTQPLACHFHDTRGFGVANAYVAVEAGIRRFDASIAGLGGCPFAPGATGNVATEDLVVLFSDMGFETGIDIPALVAASDLATELTGSVAGGRSLQWLRRQLAPRAD